MLQVMLELGVVAQVPEADVSAGRATPGSTSNQAAVGGSPAPLSILSGPSAPSDPYVAVPYKGRWFRIADTDVHSKLLFGSVMLLFSISEVGVRSAPSSGHCSSQLRAMEGLSGMRATARRGRPGHHGVSSSLLNRLAGSPGCSLRPAMPELPDTSQIV